MQQYLLYQAYGHIDHINECRYSLLKFLQVYNLRPPADIGIVIYTDQPQAFESFTSFFPYFDMRSLSAEQLRAWRGPQDFVHRVKIEMLRHFFTEHKGSVLYFDTDTYIRQPVAPLFAGLQANSTLMHAYEGVLDRHQSPSFQKWEKFLSEQTIAYNGKLVQFDRRLKMWNAGVLGLTSDHRELLDDVLALTDSVYQRFPKHITEQFAFSYCLQKKGAVQTTEEVVKHYWNLKEFRSLLRTFFQNNQEESIPNLLKAVHYIDADTIQQEKHAFQQLPFYRKWLQTLSGRRWSIRQYERKL